MHTWFWWGKLKEEEHCKVLGVGGRIILKSSLKKYGEDVD
jgi:hypothetical protein